MFVQLHQSVKNTCVYKVRATHVHVFGSLSDINDVDINHISLRAVAAWQHYILTQLDVCIL